MWEPKSLADQPTPGHTETGWEDLLEPLRRPLVEASGNGWALNAKLLISGPAAWSTLTMPGSYGDIGYTLRLKIRQMDPEDGLSVILPVGSAHAVFDLERNPQQGRITTLNLDGRESATVPGAVKGKQIKDREPHDLELTVQRSGADVRFESQMDGHPLFQWSGPASSLGLPKEWGAIPPGHLGLGSFRSDWVVCEVKVKRLEK